MDQTYIIKEGDFRGNFLYPLYYNFFPLSMSTPKTITAPRLLTTDTSDN